MEANNKRGPSSFGLSIDHDTHCIVLHQWTRTWEERHLQAGSICPKYNNTAAPSNYNDFSRLDGRRVKTMSRLFPKEKTFHLSASLPPALFPPLLPSFLPLLGFSSSQAPQFNSQEQFRTPAWKLLWSFFVCVLFCFAAADSRHLFLLQKQTNAKHVLVHIKLYKLKKKKKHLSIFFFHCISGQRILV